VRLAAFKVKFKGEIKQFSFLALKKPAGRTRNGVEGAVRYREVFIERVRIPTEGTAEQRHLRQSQWYLKHGLIGIRYNSMKRHGILKGRASAL